jgi:hypothetical protein
MMSEYTIVVSDEDTLGWEANQAQLDKKAWIEQYIAGKLELSRPNYLANEAAKNKAEYDAKVAAYDTAKPTLDKMAALPEKEAKLVQDILDGKVTSADVVKP